MANGRRIKRTEPYKHEEATSPMRPEAGTQPQFKNAKPPEAYRYDSSLAPELQWDENPARAEAEALLAEISGAETLEEAKAKAQELLRISKPFLNWAGKAERAAFDVPTLPLFVHERLSTSAILETLRGHKRDKQLSLDDLFGETSRSLADSIVGAYEYPDKWVNRLILGDSLVVMNSLLQFEQMGGQVQMVYFDPPYGIKYKSNFQPFVRKTDVTHGSDTDMTREPEMVRAYRDTWTLGLHSWLTYLRDRLVLTKDLLSTSGSLFLQINDENVGLARMVCDEVFGRDNFVSQITFQTTSGFDTNTIATLGDFLLWYAKDKEHLRVNKLYQRQPVVPGEGNASWVLLPDGSYRGVTAAEKRREVPLPPDAKLYKPDNIQSQGEAREEQVFVYDGIAYRPNANSHWKANYPAGMQRLADAGRIHVARNSIQYRRFTSDFPYQEIGSIWTDTLTGSFLEDKVYAVKTNDKVVDRCILLTTDPGDLVLDPTCGGGTTALAAERWGRRWITTDVSRVPLAITRQRLLTALHVYFELQDERRGPVSGFVYKRRQNRSGEEVGGIVPHLKLENIANDEPAKEDVLVDQPEIVPNVVRVTGPFAVEASIPLPLTWGQEEDAPLGEQPDTNDGTTYLDRMIRTLKSSPTIRLPGNQSVTLSAVRPLPRSLALHAEAAVPATAPSQTPSLVDVVDEAMEVNGQMLPGISSRPVAIVFGPENGTVTERLVFEAAREAYAKSFTHLYVIGFAIEPNARLLVDKCAEAVGVSATYLQATPDLMMGDLLKNMRSSQLFSVCALPDVTVRKAGDQYAVQLHGLDVFDAATQEHREMDGDDVPAWFLDTDYNGRVFHVSQAFFPRTSAWDALKNELRREFEPTVWAHLSGTTSAPFEAGEHQTVAIKVIDDRGNELLVVKSLSEAE